MKKNLATPSVLQYKNAVWGNKKSFGLGVATASHQHVVQFTEHIFKGLDPGQKLDVLILFGLEVGFQHLDGLFRGIAVLSLLIREGWQVRRKTCSRSFRVFEHGEMATASPVSKLGKMVSLKWSVAIVERFP